MSKVLLVDFSGEIEHLSTLILDNGMANLAASLIQAGHSVKILDYGVVDTIKHFKKPKPLVDETIDIARQVITSLNNDDKLSKEFRERVSLAAAKVEAIVEEKTLTIARDIAKIADAEGYNIVGLKIWNGDGYTGNLVIAREIKRRNKDIFIIGGGPHVDWFGEVILEASNDIDVLIRGEGEKAIIDLVDFTKGEKRLEQIPNIIYRKGKEIVKNKIEWLSEEEFNRLPMPIYHPDIYPAILNNQKFKFIVIDESRGCPYSCNFCIHPIKSGRKWRLKQPKEVIKEMCFHIENSGVSTFFFAGSTAPPMHKKNIAEEIIRKGIKVNYVAFGHVKDADLDTFKKMRKSGCYSLFFGIESGSQFILNKAHNKNIPVDHIKQAIKLSKEAGIFTVGSIIIPSPFENEHTLDETFNLLIDTMPDSVVITPPGIIPGTKWETNHKRFNFEIQDQRDFLRNFSCVKIKTLHPPIEPFWKILPYKVNNKSFYEYGRENFLFTTQLEKKGILTGIPHDFALISYTLNTKIANFKEKVKYSLMVGDNEYIKECVIVFNTKQN